MEYITNSTVRANQVSPEPLGVPRATRDPLSHLGTWTSLINVWPAWDGAFPA